MSNHLAEWIRQSGFTDSRKAPTHALRHWFKTAAARAGVADSIADFLQGHTADADAATYRHFDLPMLATALSKITAPTAGDQRQSARTASGDRYGGRFYAIDSGN